MNPLLPGPHSKWGGDDDSAPAVVDQPSKIDRTRAQRKATRTAELAATKAKPKSGSGFEDKVGELNRNAASIGMGALYGARLVRHDLLRAIQRLAEKFHA